MSAIRATLWMRFSDESPSSVVAPAILVVMPNFSASAVEQAYRDGDPYARELWAEVGELLLHTHQHDFPVVLGSDYLGLLTRERLIQGIAQPGRDAFASSVMDRDAPTAGPDDSLLGHLQSYGQDAFPIVIIDADQRVLGLVTRDNLMEYMLLRRLA
jgi:hypothetical protein